jgi:translocator protein
MKCGGSLILFLVLVLGGGLAIGFLTAPGEWYAGLGKPGFIPIASSSSPRTCSHS